MTKDDDKRDPNSLLMPSIFMGDTRRNSARAPASSPSYGKRFETHHIAPLGAKKIKSTEEKETATPPSGGEKMTSKNYREVYKKREKARQQLAKDKADLRKDSVAAREKIENEQFAQARRIKDELAYWRNQRDAPDGTHETHVINNMIDELQRKLACLPSHMQY